jgi:hypothetical protein
MRRLLETDIDPSMPSGDADPAEEPTIIEIDSDSDE